MHPQHPDVPALGGARRGVISLIILATMLATLAIAAPASATEPSGICSNGAGDEIHLVNGELGLPLWLNIQYGLNGGSEGVLVCYATSDPDGPKVAGGFLILELSNSGTYTHVESRSDSNDGVGIDGSALVTSDPSYTVSPGGTSGGQAVSFSIPIWVCAGTCVSPGLATTGVVVGSISQTPAGPGGVSLAYSVSSLCLLVNGVPVTSCSSPTVLPGATTTGASPVNVGTDPGPCVLAVCVPSPNIRYVATSGAQLATIFLPGVGAVPVYGVSNCVYRATPSTPCPA